MTCSVCQQSGHNKRTCPKLKQVATTGKYAGLNAIQIEAIFAERERQNYEEIVVPIFGSLLTLRLPKPKPKSSCADCGQVETECRLEITAEGKILCCDCLYREKYPDATCYRCDKKLYSCGIVLCGGGGGECETWYCADCHADGTHDCPVCAYDDETVSVESEDLCECCGRPYDHRNPHRQSEMCDCVQNDDGTLSRPEEEDKNWNCPDCRHWFDEGKNNCKSCDFDLNSWNKCECCERPYDRRWFDEGKNNCKSCDFDLNS